VPKKGPFDPRVRIVDYNPLDVVKLLTFYGVETHIHFGEGEEIKDVAVGDDEAWKIVSRTNNIFIKPLAERADTNVTVVTNKKIYQFALVVQPKPITDDKAWSDPNLVFSLSFRYPDDEAAALKDKLKIEAALEAAKERKQKIKLELSEAPSKENYDYWVAGSGEISPTSAYDDGRFMYLTFSNNRDMPAIYAVDEDEKESLINTHVIGNQIIIQRMVKQLILRKGNEVASVLNKSFSYDGGRDNTTGTMSNKVQRVLKGDKTNEIQDDKSAAHRIEQKKQPIASQEQVEKKKSPQKSKDDNGNLVDSDKLDSRYLLKGSADWRPTRIYNDGKSTFIEFPASVHTEDVPILIVNTGSGVKTVNYQIVDHANNLTMQVDGVFDDFSLISGLGDDQQEIKIKRNI
jgi:type IV secretion system protein VirB9